MQFVKLNNPAEGKSVSEQVKVTILKQHISDKLQYSNSSKPNILDQASQLDELRADCNLRNIDDFGVNKTINQKSEIPLQSEKEAIINSEYANCSLDKPPIKDIEYDKTSLKIEPKCLSTTTELQLQEINNVIKKNSKFAQMKKNPNLDKS